MKQITCKRFFILGIHLCVLINFALAQDSANTSQRYNSSKTTSETARNQQYNQKAEGNPVYNTDGNAALTSPLPQQKDGSLNGQYQTLLKHSWLQKGYRLVLPGELNRLWKSVSDSLRKTKKDFVKVQIQLDSQSTLVNALKAQAKFKLDSAANIPVAPSYVNVMGTSVDTTTYNWIMLGIIFSLIAALAIVLFVINKNASDSKLYKQQFNEVNDEYHTYKVKANEKEKKLARELQTERNTIEELKAKREEELASSRKKKP